MIELPPLGPFLDGLPVVAGMLITVFMVSVGFHMLRKMLRLPEPVDEEPEPEPFELNETKLEDWPHTLP